MNQAAGRRWQHGAAALLRRNQLCRCPGPHRFPLPPPLPSPPLRPQAYVLARPCSWFSGTVVWCAFVRWTCWNCLFFLYWIEADCCNPSRGRWGAWPRRGRPWPDAASRAP